MNMNNMNKKRSINLNWILLLLQKILNLIDILTDVLVILGLVAITLIVFVEVLARYVFMSPISWSIEIVRLFFVWTILLGVSITERFDAHFRVTAFVDFLPKKVGIFVNLLAELVVIITLIILFFISLSYVEQGSRGISTVLQIPLNYLYVSLPIGIVLALCSRLRKVWNSFRGIRNFSRSEVKVISTPRLEQIDHLNYRNIREDE